jgi:hypothetical protein
MQVVIGGIDDTEVGDEKLLAVRRLRAGQTQNQNFYMNNITESESAARTRGAFPLHRNVIVLLYMRTAMGTSGGCLY